VSTVLIYIYIYIYAERERVQGFGIYIHVYMLCEQLLPLCFIAAHIPSASAWKSYLGCSLSLTCCNIIRLMGLSCLPWTLRSVIM